MAATSVVAREICIRSGNQNICKSSPIRDCSCNQATFVDPFFQDPDPTEFPTPEALMDDLRRVFAVWERSQRTAGDLKKLLVLWKITQLVLLKEIDIDKPFIITAM